MSCPPPTPHPSPTRAATAGAVHVPHGDWRRFMAQHRLDDAGDDWARTLAARDAAMTGAGSAAGDGSNAAVEATAAEDDIAASPSGAAAGAIAVGEAR
jgi:hypothetical protein